MVEFDEIGALTRYVSDRKIKDQINDRLSVLTTQGRALGITIRGYVQEPTKDTVPVRDLFPRRICLRVATKFVNVAKRYYAEQGRQVEVIKLYGSMELAPLVGLADKIIDVVDTGKTLRANGLEPQELIAHISSRLIVNKASMKMQHARIQALIDTLREAVESRHRA